MNSRGVMEEKDGIVGFNAFVYRHKIQLERSAVPQKFWFALYKKLHKSIFDAGEAFALFKIDYEGDKRDSDPLYTVLVSREDGINCDDGLHVYLVDHAWTYTSNRAVSDLNQFPGLLTRMCNLMDISDDLSSEEKIDKVCSEMWKYNQTYSYGFGEVENQVPLWYIMDEFGSAIQHSDDPNFRAIPFYYIPEQISYTILFPVKNVGYNECVTRNYLEGSQADDELATKALLMPWKPSSFANVTYNQVEPGNDYFLYGHAEESLPDGGDTPERHSQDTSRPLKVYTEYRVIIENLTDPNFEIVTDEELGDVLWLNSHFKNYRDLSERFPDKFINQFPFEHVVTVKDLFSVVCRRKKKRTGDGDAFADNPPWCPTTFNLKTELPKFVSCYQQREEQNLNNHWICKPWNLARGVDIVITNNLNCIVRLPFTGPKIAQKYVDKPVLFDRPDVGLVKFDVRYVVLVKSLSPLRVYAYRNFFLRFANKAFDMDDLWDTEKHFTVMNYNDNAPLFKMLCSDFVVEFDRQNPCERWESIEERIFASLRDVFEAAVAKPPPSGMAHYRRSRALYAVDLILSREKTKTNAEFVQHKLLEINWNPDCRRACEYYPTFFNDVFLLLFKDVENENLFRLL